MSTRRRATELDRLLDRLGAGEEPEATGDLAPLLHPARVARATLVRPIANRIAREHLAALRVDRARNLVVAVTAPRQNKFRPARLAVVAAIVVVLGCGSAVAASARALPGDAFYGIKRAAERISLALHRDPVGKAALHLQFAQTRLQEIEALRADGQDVSSTVQALEDELEAAEADALNAQALGKDVDALLAHVQDMIAKHIAVLQEVQAKVPEQAQDAIQRAIDNAQKAKEKVERAHNRPHGKPTSAPGNSGSAPGRS